MTIGDPRYDWRYRTKPEAHLGGRRLDWPRGRGLGGSSAINGLIYVRGQMEDFDGWGAVAPGWAYDDVLPYFRRAERQERGASAFHGADGPIGISDGRARFPVTDLFVETAEAAGLPFNPDCNGATQQGVGNFQTTTWKGWRVSAAHGYLNPVRSRSNLRVVTDARVTGIAFDGTRATGVYVRQGGESRLIGCAGEVLLSAGAIGSPHLLLVSGVGSAEDLAGFGLAPVVNSPRIGRGLQDHLKFHNSYRVRMPTLNQQLNSWFGKAVIGAQFALFRRGPLTMGAGPVFAFLKSVDGIDRPDIQFHVLPWSRGTAAKGFDRFPGFSVSICPIRPESRGEIRLKSADPLVNPAIHGNYLSTENDRRTIVAGLHRAREICGHNPLADQIVEEIWPGPDAVAGGGDALLDAIKAHVTTIFHPVGTVAMGEGGPLDERCRVRGAKGLRVVDASVMPSIVSGNTNAAVNMIAEKASEMILEDSR